jgi:hypothetical protein
MDNVLSWFLDASAPLWLVVTLAILQLIGHLRTLWATLTQIGRWIRVLSRYAAHRVRLWLNVKKVVGLTQSEYDALPVKEPDTVYMITADR